MTSLNLTEFDRLISRVRLRSINPPSAHAQRSVHPERIASWACPDTFHIEKCGLGVKSTHRNHSITHTPFASIRHHSFLLSLNNDVIRIRMLAGMTDVTALYYHNSLRKQLGSHVERYILVRIRFGLEYNWPANGNSRDV